VNQLYKLFLTLNATSWVIVTYVIKEGWTILCMPTWIFGFLLLLVPIILSFASILMTLLFDKDTLEQCDELQEVNNSFLPTYLGYFFVGLGIDKVQHLAFVYLIIFVFTFVAHTQYFNPLLLLFGYRFYDIKSEAGTRVFVISKRKFRNAKEASFSNLRRINDTTYIDWG